MKNHEKLVDAGDDQEPIPVETDPTGRYHRYDDVLGRGAYKTVYKGFDGEEGIEVAWNQIRVNKIVKTEEEKERLFQEVDLLKELSHKSIIKFYASWIDEETQDVNFITEMFTSGTLRQYRKRHKKLDEKVLKSWTRQILRGLLYLHGHDPPIIHRDLKADNIFVNGNQGELKIGDLGLATLLRTTQGATSVLGTPEFMAPELYEEDYDERVDIYALGMCLLELVTFEYPYQECENAAQIYKKVSSGIRPAVLNRVENEGLKNFIMLCIEDIENRPSARELLESDYLYKAPPPPKEEKKSSSLSATSKKSKDDLQALGKGAQVLQQKQSTSSLRDMAGVDQDGPPQAAAATLDTNGHHVMMNGGQAASTDPAKREDASDNNSDSDAKSSSRESTRDNEVAPVAAVAHGNGAANGLDPAAALAPASAEASSGPPTVKALSPEFKVRGKVSEDNASILYMKLKINAEGGVCNTVSFLFDCTSDSAASVAAEMVQEFTWTEADKKVIEAAIEEEKRKLTTTASLAPAMAEDSAYRSAGAANGGSGRPAAVQMPQTGSFENVRDLSSEIQGIENEIEALCRQQREEELVMKRRHEEALQRVKSKLEVIKLRNGKNAPGSPRHKGNGGSFAAGDKTTAKPQTEQKIMQMQAKALEGLGGLGMNGDSSSSIAKNGSGKAQKSRVQ